MIIQYFKCYFKRKKERINNIKENFSEFQKIAKDNIINYKKIFSFKDIKYLFWGLLIGLALSTVQIKYKYIYICIFFVLITFFLYTVNSGYKGQEKISITAIQLLKIIVGVMSYNLFFTVYRIFFFLFLEWCRWK